MKQQQSTQSRRSSVKSRESIHGAIPSMSSKNRLNTGSSATSNPKSPKKNGGNQQNKFIPRKTLKSVLKKIQASEKQVTHKPTKCPNCNNVQVDNIIKFSCSHEICGVCLSRDFILNDFVYFINFQTQYELKCPICKLGKISFTVEELAKLLISTTSIRNEKIQLECPVHSKPLEDYCQECKKWLCFLCKETFHNVHFPNHELTKEQSEENPPCKNHSLNQSDLYCIECNEQICHMCLRKGEYHNGHLNTLISEFKKIVLDNKLDMKEPTFAKFEIYLDSLQQNFKSIFEKNYQDNKRYIENAIVTLEKLRKEYIDKHNIYSEFVDNIFNVIKHSYSNFYFDLTRHDLSFKTLTFLQKVTKELQTFNFTVKHAENFEQMNENLNKIDPNNLFQYELQFIHHTLNLKKAIQTDSSIYSVCKLKNGNICVGQQNGHVVVYNPESKDPIEVYKEHKKTVFCVKELLGELLATGAGDGNLKLWDLTGERKPVELPKENPKDKKEKNSQPLSKIQSARSIKDEKKEEIKVEIKEEIKKDKKNDDDDIYDDFEDEVDDKKKNKKKGDFFDDMFGNDNDKSLKESQKDSVFSPKKEEEKKEELKLEEEKKEELKVEEEKKEEEKKEEEKEPHEGPYSYFTFKGHTSDIYGIQQVSENEICSCSKDSLILFWDLTKFTCTRKFSEHKRGVHCLLYPKKSNVLISGGADCRILIWEIKEVVEYNSPNSSNRQPLRTVKTIKAQPQNPEQNNQPPSVIEEAHFEQLKGHTNTVTSLLLLHNNNIASSSCDKTIRVWNLQTKNCLFELKGHRAYIWGLIELEDTNKIVSCSSDSTVKLWNLETRKCENSAQIHKGDITNIITISKRELCTVGIDNYIKIWNH